MVDFLFRNDNKRSNKIKINSFKQLQRVELIQKFVEDLIELNHIHDNSSIYHCGGSMDVQKINKLHDKLNKANETYAQGSAYGYILFVDTTTFGSGKCGMLFTEKSFYICSDHGDNIRQYRYEDLFGFTQFKSHGGDLLMGWSTYEFYASTTMNKLQPVFELMKKYFSENHHLSLLLEN